MENDRSQAICGTYSVSGGISERRLSNEMSRKQMKCETGGRIQCQGHLPGSVRKLLNLHKIVEMCGMLSNYNSMLAGKGFLWFRGRRRTLQLTCSSECKAQPCFTGFPPSHLPLVDRGIYSFVLVVVRLESR